MFQKSGLNLDYLNQDKIYMKSGQNLDKRTRTALKSHTYTIDLHWLYSIIHFRFYIKGFKRIQDIITPDFSTPDFSTSDLSTINSSTTDPYVVEKFMFEKV